MTVFLVANINIHDREQYANYEAGFMQVFSEYKGRMLAVSEAQEVLEGDWPYTRTVMIEFPSREDARAWYDSDAYQALAQHRFAASVGNIALVEGLDGG